MRELKFRAWCVLGGKGSFIYFDIDDRNNLDFDIFDEIPIIHQFTGATDKKKKDIFEGDIVSYESWSGSNKKTRTGRIIFEYLGYHVESFDGDLNHLFDVLETCEVIENIFEK